MGFIRQQEVRLAIRLLIWQYERMKLPVPVLSELERKLINMAIRENEASRTCPIRIGA